MQMKLLEEKPENSENIGKISDNKKILSSDLFSSLYIRIGIVRKSIFDKIIDDIRSKTSKTDRKNTISAINKAQSFIEIKTNISKDVTKITFLFSKFTTLQGIRKKKEMP